MEEVAVAGEDHGETGRVSSRNHLVITHGAAGLDYRRCTGLDG